jgi:hypothetical protein
MQNTKNKLTIPAEKFKKIFFLKNFRKYKAADSHRKKHKKKGSFLDSVSPVYPRLVFRLLIFGKGTIMPY